MARHHIFTAAHRTITAIDDPTWHQAQDDLDACAPHIRDVIARIMDARPSALGAASYDGEKVTAGKGSSSTERLALAPQHTTADLRRLDVALAGLDAVARRTAHPNAPRAAERHAAALWRIVQAWRPELPTARQKRIAEQNLLNALPECAHTRATVDKFEPVHRTSDLGGLLDHPLPLCSFVYKFARRVGRLPTHDEMRRHHEGRRLHITA